MKAGSRRENLSWVLGNYDPFCCKFSSLYLFSCNIKTSMSDLKESFPLHAIFKSIFQDSLNQCPMPIKILALIRNTSMPSGIDQHWDQCFNFEGIVHWSRESWYLYAYTCRPKRTIWTYHVNSITNASLRSLLSEHYVRMLCMVRSHWVLVYRSCVRLITWLCPYCTLWSDIPIPDFTYSRAPF